MHSAIFRSVRMLATYFQMLPECIFTERYIQYGKTLKLVNRDEECMCYIFRFFYRFEYFQNRKLGKSHPRPEDSGMITLVAIYYEHMMH